MNKLIRPLSEEFLFCSPEMPERSYYRIMVLSQKQKPRVQKIRLKEWKRHVPEK
jgi:hypothetical protein